MNSLIEISTIIYASKIICIRISLYSFSQNHMHNSHEISTINNLSIDHDYKRIKKNTK